MKNTDIYKKAIKDFVEAIEKNQISQGSYLIDMTDFQKIAEQLIENPPISESEIINCNDYIGMTLWRRENISEVLSEKEIPDTKNNIDAVVSCGLVRYLAEATESGWNTINECINIAKQDNLLVSEPKSMKDLVFDGEELISFGIEGDYCTYHFIAEHYDDKTDISACLEETLHRMMDAEIDEDTIRLELGAVDYEDEDFNEEAAISIDLGWYLPSSISSVWQDSDKK